MDKLEHIEDRTDRLRIEAGLKPKKRSRSLLRPNLESVMRRDIRNQDGFEDQFVVSRKDIEHLLLIGHSLGLHDNDSIYYDRIEDRAEEILTSALSKPIHPR